MAHPSGAALAARREAIGVTVDEAAAGIGLNPQAIRALESDDPVLAGPHAGAWLAAYSRWLERQTVVGLDAPPDYITEAIPTSVPPRQRPEVRGVAMTLLVLASVAMAGSLWSRRQTAAEVAPAGSVQVRIVLQHNAPLVVWSDGVRVHDRMFYGKESVDVPARQRVDVDVEDISAVRLFFGDREVEPRGRLDVPRRLSFIAGVGEG
jgi:hypothetical protein